MPKAESSYTLREMQQSEIAAACGLISASMNPAEAKWARKTFDFHFKSRSHDLDDGRQYFCYGTTQQLVAMVGLHHYTWGPDENVWLAWFAVHPDFQRKGIGRNLLNTVEEAARVRGYRKLYVETYDHPDFNQARQFYEACGFCRAGGVSQYLPGSEDMIVYLKHLR